MDGPPFARPKEAPGGSTTKRGRASAGITAIETIVALAILGLVSVAFLSGLSTSLHATRLADVRSTAQTLAQTHMEFVRSQDYSDTIWDYAVTATSRNSSVQPSWWDPDSGRPPLLPADYTGYVVQASSEHFDVDNDGTDEEGIRRITVVVKHLGEEVLRIQDYEVDR